MKRILRLLSTASAVVLAVGCREATSPKRVELGLQLPWVPEPTAVIFHGYHSGATSAMRAVVADEQAWAATWAQLTGGLQPPIVDFTNDVVLVAALGQRFSGGFDIRIDSLAFHGGTVAYVTTSAPGPTCFTTQAVTSPLYVVRVSQTLEPITFHDSSVVIDCGPLSATVTRPRAGRNRLKEDLREK